MTKKQTDIPLGDALKRIYKKIQADENAVADDAAVRQARVAARVQHAKGVIQDSGAEALEKLEEAKKKAGDQ